MNGRERGDQHVGDVNVLLLPLTKASASSTKMEPNYAVVSAAVMGVFEKRAAANSRQTLTCILLLSIQAVLVVCPTGDHESAFGPMRSDQQPRAGPGAAGLSDEAWKHCVL